MNSTQRLFGFASINRREGGGTVLHRFREMNVRRPEVHALEIIVHDNFNGLEAVSHQVEEVVQVNFEIFFLPVSVLGNQCLHFGGLRHTARIRNQGRKRKIELAYFLRKEEDLHVFGEKCLLGSAHVWIHFQEVLQPSEHANAVKCVVSELVVFLPIGGVVVKLI